MKKIGIITSSCAKNGTYGCNYGAALQGFALVKLLRIMGYEAYDLNYVSENEYRPQQYGFLRRTIKRIPMVFNLRLLKGKINDIYNRRNREINYNAFQQFVQTNKLTYHDGQFYNIKQLSDISSEFHAFITGSDVVWNPFLHRGINDKGYFLDFVHDGVKRIAYAPSIGTTELPETSICDLGELLRKFDALSVREKTGARLIKDTTGIDVEVVLDPTLLLYRQQYDDIAKTPKDLPGKYIAVYRFGTIPHTLKRINEISTQLDLPIVYIPSNNTGEFIPRYDFGPSEFLAVIKNATLVLTDSFHCSVFSIIYHKPFLTFNRSKPKDEENINSRMTDLLNMLDLSHRMVNIGDDIDYNTLLEIDYTEADKKLNILRDYSLSYLKKSLL